MPRHYEDFSGKTVNGVIIKSIVADSGGAGKHKRWICECPICHEDFICQSNHIKKRQIAGCQSCVRSMREDLTGRVFGHLTVKRMLPAKCNERSLCYCICDCGSSNVIVQANHLKSGETRSCGCVLSFPEEYIASLLAENNIEFEKQKSFPNLRYKNPLRFDFYLPNKNMVIEYNGEQHYRPVEYFGGEAALEIVKKRDMIKCDYCIENNIGLLIIRYDEDIKEILIKNNVIMKR